MFVNIKKIKKEVASCDSWTFIYTTTTADLVILLFFRREGLFRVLCAFVLCANRTDPKNLSRREREREREILVDFVRRRIAEWAEWRQTAAQLTVSPSHNSYSDTFRAERQTGNNLFFFFCSFAVFFHRLVFVWSQSPSAPFMDVTSIIHKPRTAAGYNPKL